MKCSFKRGISLFLSAVFCLTVLLSAFPVFAAGEQAEVYINSYPYAHAEDGHPVVDQNPYHWGCPSDMQFKNGWQKEASEFIKLRAMNSFNGKICYCIEIGVGQHTGDNFTSHDENFWDNYPSGFNDVIDPSVIKEHIGRLFEYGYTGNINRYWVSQNSGDADKLSHAYATQLLIWEVLVGERDAAFNHVGAGSYNEILDVVASNHPLRSKIMNHYNSMVSSMKSHVTIPSFLSESQTGASTVTLEWDGSSYSTVLTDSNNVLADFSFTSNDGNIRFTKNGNNLTIKTSVLPDGNVAIEAVRNDVRYGIITWSDGESSQSGGSQDTVTYAQEVTDPVRGFLNLNANPADGSLKIIKTSADGNVANITFVVTGSDINQTVKTDTNGEILIENLSPGTYSVKEIVPEGYIPAQDNPQTVTVAAGETATVTFTNSVKPGKIKIIKLSDDGNVAGIDFTITGNGINETVTTGADGTIISGELDPGTYTVTEIVPAGYQPQEPKTVTVNAGETATVTFTNSVKPGKIKIIKLSDDGNVAGIDFTITGSGINETVTTGADGTITSGELDPGTYTVTEIVPAGYQPQEPKTVTVNAGKTATVTFTNSVKPGKIKIIKLSDDGNVAGIDFTITGSGINETVTTGADGTITSGELDPGTYTVTEIVPEGYQPQEPKTVTVNAGETATVTFTNSVKPGKIKIIKLSDDGNVAGIDFTITGNGVNLTLTTGADGTITSGELDPGTYTVTEIVPDGYQPQEPKTVTVNAGETAIVTFNNSLKCGSLKIIKTSEDGRVSGITFVITGSGLNLTAKTNESGEIIIPDLLPGIYTVEEQVSDEYETQPAQTVTVEYDKIATVTFNNVLKRGALKIVKTAEDGKIEGITFTITGESFNQTAVTDGNGVILLENLLPGIYTIEEQTSDEYEPQPAQTVTVEYDKIATVTFNNVLRRGALKIVKTAENGIIVGISFTITGENFNQTAATDENGEIIIHDLLPGVYTVEEQTPDEYEPQPAQTVTVEYDKTVTVTFNNILKKGSLKVIKSSEDNFIEGLKFRLFGISLSGAAIDMYAVTNADGEAVFENIPISGDTPYTVEEVDTPIRYVVPESQEVIIVWNEATSVNFENSLKKFTVSVVKTDAETGTAQGGATLSGAVYGIYKDNQLIDEYTTDENGSFVTTEYVCGNDWTIREIKPSVGYTLDETVYVVGAEPGNFVIEHNALSLDVTERVIKAQISITKLADDDCDTQVDIPEAGAEFEIFLKSAGSYEAAAESERDIISCNENGYGITKALPYGLYTVHQTKGWEGYEFVEDFDALLETDGEIYRIVISNHIYRYLLRVVKTDTETGAVIPVAGAGFRIFDPNGEAVTMLVNYPSPHIVDTFYTDETGSFLTPGTLKYGRGYSLVEVQAPEGYVLDPTPVFFDVTPETVVTEDGEQIITVTISDMPQKGVIKIEKHGEVFAAVSFDEETGTYTPVYSERGILGAVFEIYAAEDITTPDGTVRAEKGTLVDTVTTDENGIAQSRELYLGKYEVKELNAPYGLILNSEIYPAELTYAGQEIAVTAAEISVFNERQRVKISLSKTLESDALFGIRGEFSCVRFGLFAAEDIAAADGDIIPKDGLIETVTVDENGNAVFNTDIPFGHYYVKEISTDEGYVLNDEKYPAAFEYAGQELAAVEIALNNGEPVVNELIYGRVKGYKVDDEGHGLGGALIGLFNSNDVEFTEENALMTVLSNADGSFSFENVPFGIWYVRELASPAGYVLDGTAYPVQITENEQIIEIEIGNKLIRGNIALVKLNAYDTAMKLSGAVFAVYADTNGSGEYDAGDALIGKLGETEPGVYMLSDLPYGSYFIKEIEAPDGFILDNGFCAAVIENDGETVWIENSEGIGFINAPFLGNLKIIKTSDDGVIEGFSFRITGVYGYDKTFVTDENGEIFIEGLPIGLYVVSEIRDEVSAPYQLPDDIEVNIVFDTVVTVEMHNSLLTEPPQTGGMSRLWLGIALVIGSVGFMCIGGIIIYHKKRK